MTATAKPRERQCRVSGGTYAKRCIRCNRKIHAGEWYVIGKHGYTSHHSCEERKEWKR
jgi:hypothetical protein